MKSLLSALLALCLAINAFAENVVQFNAADSSMNDAIDGARATLPVFMRHAFNKNGEATPGASVKVSVPVSSGKARNEHIWVGYFRAIGNDQYEGLLMNEPQHFEAEFGDKITFHSRQISDWSFWANGKQYGAYTTRVIVARETSEAAQAAKAELSAQILPKGW